jgi:intraflagellar transport protein 81
MLQSLRNEVKKNRELSRDRLGLELKEKRKKIE